MRASPWTPDVSTPYWTLHFQYSNVHIRRVTYLIQTMEVKGPNGDGIITDSTQCTHARLPDGCGGRLALLQEWQTGWGAKLASLGDDDFGQLKLDGHGLPSAPKHPVVCSTSPTKIFLNGAEGHRIVRSSSDDVVVAGYAKTGRGRGPGAHSWINITGNNAIAFVGFSENHGTSPTRASHWPDERHRHASDPKLAD